LADFAQLLIFSLFLFILKKLELEKSADNRADIFPTSNWEKYHFL